jgi:hypothetical protein
VRGGDGEERWQPSRFAALAAFAAVIFQVKSERPTPNVQRPTSKSEAEGRALLADAPLRGEGAERMVTIEFDDGDGFIA